VSKRAERRHHARRIVENRKRLHVAVWWTETHSDCYCQLRPHTLLTLRPFSCNCSKRRPGRPRLARGMCDIGARDHVYQWRRQARELNRAIVHRHMDLQGDEIAALTGTKKRWDW